MTKLYRTHTMTTIDYLDQLRDTAHMEEAKAELQGHATATSYFRGYRQAMEAALTTLRREE